MEPHQAAEHLQVIRTLMERSALYRRALAPILLWCGVLGLLGATLGVLLPASTMFQFGALWLGAAVLAVAGSFLLARRQAMRDHEPFWSAPARRVAQALLPALACGCVLDVLLVLADAEEILALFVVLSALFYGCALHAAGFFMVRGVKLFAWLFIAGGLGLLVFLSLVQPDFETRQAHLCMGGFFGAAHLAYGLYLHFTRRPEAVA
jgi:FtsH-binding integral membrane protein